MRQIKPSNNHGSIVIRFTYQGERYHLSKLGSYEDSSALTRANAIAHSIYLDCLARKFAGDPQVYLGEQVKIPKRRKKLSFLQIWDLWVDSLDLPPHTLENHYRYCRVLIEAHIGNGVMSEDASWFVKLREEVSAATWNSRRGYLKSCVTWAINEGHHEGKNPFASLRASTKKSEYKVNPFSRDEVRAILNAIETNHSHYLPFMKFLFSTGCRTGEAVGLKWEHISFTNRTITITESNSKRGSGRIQKETKAGSTVVLPMGEGNLYQLLAVLNLKANKEYPEDLVFLSPTGKPINPDNFRERIWKPVLKKLGLEYRPLYQTRHTVLSRIANEQGLLAAAAVAGHRDATMVTKHYAKFQGEIKLPELDAGHHFEQGFYRSQIEPELG